MKEMTLMENEIVPFKTIDVDFDGTLCYSKCPELDQPNTVLIGKIRTNIDIISCGNLPLPTQRASQ